MSNEVELPRPEEAPGHLSVMAGAGAGKTTLLTRRYMHHLAQGLDPLAIVAVTFTEAAAAELRVRLRQHVSEQLPDSPALLGALEAAPISTIHALAARICREHPDEAEVPREFTILDERERLLWLGDRLEAAMALLPPALYEALSWGEVRSLLEGMLADPPLTEAALGLGPGVPSAAPAAPEAFAAWLRREAAATMLAEPAFEAAVETLRGEAGHPGDKIERLRLAALAAVEGLRAMGAEGAAPEPVFVALEAVEFRGRLATQTPEDVVGRLRAAIELVRKALRGSVELRAVAGEVDRELEALRPVVIEAWKLVQAHLKEAKHRSRKLEFADLEQGAVTALRHDHVRAHYAARWRAVIVDEFQDTNPLQEDLIRGVSEAAIRTVVGDLKQSIYGFRGAAPSVFERLHEEFKRTGTDHELATSYRTHAGLLEAINAICAPLLRSLHAPLRAARPAPGPGPFVRHLGFADDGDAPKLAMVARRRIEAHHVALTLRQMLDEGVPVEEDRRLVKLEARHIAVLARTWDALGVFEEALDAAGIPAVQTRGGNLLETQAATDALSLLAWLAAPRDDVALVALLRSPFFALDDARLSRFAQAAGLRDGWWAALEATAEPGWQAVRGTLDGWRNARGLEAPSALLARADRDRGYTAVVGNMPGGRRRLADWRGVVALVRDAERGAADVAVVVRHLRQLLAAGASFERPVLEAGEAASLLTIHSAKGLEWPVVAVVDLGREPRRDDAEVRLDPGLGLGMRLGGSESATGGSNGARPVPLRYRAIGRKRHLAQQAEAGRLAYVALTRARDHLLLSSAAGDRGLMALLAPGLEAARTLVPGRLATQRVPLDPAWSRPPARRKTEWPQGLPELPGACGPGLDELPVTALAVYARCPAWFRFAVLEGHPGEVPPATRGSGELPNRAAWLGTLVHKALEERVRGRTALETLAARQGSRLQADPEALAEASDLVECFHTAPAFAHFREVALAAEQPFVHALGPLRLRGVIDAVGPGFVLDYKTDREVVPAHHRLQLAVYARVAGVGEASLAYLRAGRRHDFGPEELAAGYAEALALAEAIGRGELAPSPSLEGCSQCPFARLCEACPPGLVALGEDEEGLPGDAALEVEPEEEEPEEV